MTCSHCGGRTQNNLCRECRLERDYDWYVQRAEEWEESDDD